MPDAPQNMNYMHPGNSTEEERREIITRRFTYKQWTPEQVASGKKITESAIEFGVAIMEGVPASGTRTRALNLIEEARMLANAAITHGGEF